MERLARASARALARQKECNMRRYNRNSILLLIGVLVANFSMPLAMVFFGTAGFIVALFFFAWLLIIIWKRENDNSKRRFS